MVALLMDGPMADREIEVDEPRPTIEPARDVAGCRVVHRYRLAEVELAAVLGTQRRVVRRAVYVYDGDVFERSRAKAA